MDAVDDDFEPAMEGTPLINMRVLKRRRVPLILGCGLFALVLFAVLGTFIYLAVSDSAAPVPGLIQCPDNDVNVYTAAKTVWLRNRASLREALKDYTKGFVFLVGNSVQETGDSDTALLFRQESNFMYCSGAELPDCYIAMDLATGYTTFFYSFLDEVWNGVNLTPEQWTQTLLVNETLLAGALPTFLKTRADEGDVMYTLGRYNSTTESMYPAPLRNVNVLEGALLAARAIKNFDEIAIIRQVSESASLAHNALMRAVGAAKAQEHEYSAEAFYLDNTYACGLLRRQGYSAIVASGYNSAILHYEENSAPLVAGSLLLIDAGGQFKGYQTDITRSYPVDGSFTARQRGVYEAVLAAQLAGEKTCGPGVSLRDEHNAAITQSLAESIHALGLTTVVNVSLVSRFCPHGYSHSVGLDVHDAPTLSAILEEGNVLTIEPGLYFNHVLLNDDYFATEPQIVASEVRKYLTAPAFGGIRIEDTYVVGAAGCESLSNAAKSIDAIEAMMKK